MQRRDGLTKALGLTGTVLTWIPVVLPLGLGLLHFAEAGRFRVDYLMPGELFPVVALGAALLLWAALRARSQGRLIAGAAGIGMAALVISQAAAVATGLASADTEPAGFPLALVLGLYAIYPLAVVVLGIGGVRLLRLLFQSQPAGLPSA